MIVRILGILAVVIGITMMAYSGFNFVTTENIVDAGPIQINRERNHTIQWPPIVGVVLLAGGILALVLDIKRSKTAA